MNRIAWIQIKKFSPTDLESVRLNCYKFENEILIRNQEVVASSKIISKIMQSRMFLDGALAELKSLVLPERNEYIAEYKDQYIHMIDNLNRYLKRIDTFLEEMDRRSSIEKMPATTFGLKNLINFLKEGMSSLIIMPLVQSIKMFNSEDLNLENGNKAVKDAKLFSYFVFLNLYHSSELLGGIAREQNPSKGMANLNTRMVLPNLPQNVEVEQIPTEQIHELSKSFAEPIEFSEEEEYV